MDYPRRATKWSCNRSLVHRWHTGGAAPPPAPPAAARERRVWILTNKQQGFDRTISIDIVVLKQQYRLAAIVEFYRRVLLKPNGGY